MELTTEEQLLVLRDRVRKHLGPATSHFGAMASETNQVLKQAMVLEDVQDLKGYVHEQLAILFTDMDNMRERLTSLAEKL